MNRPIRIQLDRPIRVRVEKEDALVGALNRASFSEVAIALLLGGGIPLFIFAYFLHMGSVVLSILMIGLGLFLTYKKVQKNRRKKENY